MISQDFVNKYTAQSLGNEGALGALERTDDFIAASIVDLGTSLWNSIVAIPKLFGADTDEYRVETYDVLKAVNEDWAQFYTQSRESIETASFIGGVIIPGGAALKGMKVLQAGKMGFYPTFLNETTQAARITELQKMLEMGGKATTEYRNLRWKILGANAGQETLQAVGAELAIIGSLNQHAFMEDYLKDPVQNFAIGLGIGGIIGTGLGQIAIRNTLAKELGSTSSAALERVQKNLIEVPLGISDVDKAQRYSVNARILHEIAKDTSENQLTREIAADFATRWEARAGELEQTSIFGPGLRALQDIEAKQQARSIMMQDAAFGANRVELTTFDDREFIRTKSRGGEFFTREAQLKAEKDFGELGRFAAKTRTSLIATRALDDIKPEWVELMEKGFKVSYSPYHKAWIPQDQLPFYTRAVDTGATQWERLNGVLKPNTDAIADFLPREVPTAKADKYWINTLGSVMNATLESKVYIALSDIGVQNAWLSRLARLAEGDKPLPEIYLVPDAVGDVTVGQLKKQGRQVSITDLEAHLAQTKARMARELVHSGASIQEVGIRLNMSNDTIEALLFKPPTLAELRNMNWRLYTDEHRIESDYLSQKTRMLDFTTNGTRTASLYNRNADMSARLDAKFIKQQNLNIMADAIASGNSSIAKQFYSVLDSDRKNWDIFNEQLANIVNEKAGSFFFTSADFASRRMGDIGRIASVKGQELFGVFNNVSQQTLTPLATKTRAILASQVLLNEFNETLNTLAGISGYRNIDYQTGALFKLVEIEPGAFARVPIMKANGQELAPSPAIMDWLKEMSRVGQELYNFKNVTNKIQGFKDLQDIGLWIPTFNPANKFISYVIDNAAGEGQSRVKLLAGNSPEELASLERDWRTKFGNSDRYTLVTKSQQEDYNFWQMRQDPVEMDFADITKFHSGASGLAINPVDEQFASTVIENLHNRIIHYGRKMQEMYLSDIMTQLDDMSKLNQKYIANQPTLTGKLGLAQREDAARAIKNVLLGNSQLGNYSTWKTINNGFTSMVEWSSKKVDDLYRGILGDNKDITKADFVKYAKELEQMGLKNPFQSFEDFKLAALPGDPSLAGGAFFKSLDDPRLLATTKAYRKEDILKLHTEGLARRAAIPTASAEQLIATGNSVLATTALRVLETGHAFVTAVSWPIMTLPEMFRQLPKTFLGNAQTGEMLGTVYPARAIYDGIRWRHSDAAKPHIQRWIEEGFGKSIVSEATELNQLLSSGGKGIVGKVNDIVNSKFIKTLSTPSDFAEAETRLWSLSVGFQLARRAYPGISDSGADLFAKEFLARTVGNYYAAQRPAMFQGTFGVAIGLFQTYMLTWAQQMYRSLEERSFKAVASQMLTQAGLFGMSSMPMYDVFSKTIGEHFSDKHYDLTTGTYRALPDQAAEFLVYGLPASLGVGVYTRGDLQPRLPFTQHNTLDTIAAVNASRQFIAATGHALSRVYDANGMQNKFRGLLEGIGMQSLSRPLARIVETIPLPDGQGGYRAVGAVSREGNTVATSEEVWSGPGLMSRLLASRSTEEQVKREVDYLNSFYGAVDYANRKKATETLKSAIRGGNLDDATIESVAATYLRTGTATGWSAALNEALATSEGGIDYKLGKRLRPDSPLQLMIQQNY